MALKKTIKKVIATKKEEVVPATVDPRQAAWDKHVEAYIAQNPVKGAKKKAAGVFDTIPAGFNPGNHLVKFNI